MSLVDLNKLQLIEDDVEVEGDLLDFDDEGDSNEGDMSGFIDSDQAPGDSSQDDAYRAELDNKKAIAQENKDGIRAQQSAHYPPLSEDLCKCKGADGGPLYMWEEQFRGQKHESGNTHGRSTNFEN